MLQGLIGRKVGMTQIFSEDGEMIPVTAIETGPCWVVQKKNQERDGYTAVQLGFGASKKKNTTKPMRGHFQRSDVQPTRWLREFRVDERTLEELEEGPAGFGRDFRRPTICGRDRHVQGARVYGRHETTQFCRQEPLPRHP